VLAIMSCRDVTVYQLTHTHTHTHTHRLLLCFQPTSSRHQLITFARCVTVTYQRTLCATAAPCVSLNAYLSTAYSRLAARDRCGSKKPFLDGPPLYYQFTIPGRPAFDVSIYRNSSLQRTAISIRPIGVTLGLRHKFRVLKSQSQSA